MSGLPQDVVLDHNYDGIQEYDNPTPGWWWLIFHATTVFSIVYFLFFTFSPDAWTLADEHQAAVAANLRLQFGEIGELQPDAATILKYSRDEKWLTVGKTVFAGRCVGCHATNGQGMIGPNLTDDHWKNVKKVEDIATVITNGAAGNAMPAWKTQLHPNEIVLTASYIASLRGKNLPGPRGPEGDAIPPWSAAGAPSGAAPGTAIEPAAATEPATKPTP
ncbi:MAG: cbb3-type cytochrome c oxidase N-terminal domain-containing protein [Phycisphaerae bacterium]